MRYQAALMVAVCTAMVAMAIGAMVNVTVFLTPLAAEFGWPRADVSFAYTLATLGTGLGGIAMGYFADRMALRPVVLCGALVPGAALLLLSRMGSTLELYVLHALMGALGVGALLAPLNSLASQWLPRKPGLAIGIVSAGGTAGQGLMPLLAQHLILTEGWRAAYLALGLVYLALMVPLSLFLRAAPPGAAAQARSGSLPSGRLLALLSLAVILCCICMATPIVHVASLGSDLGLSGRDAAGLLTVMMLVAMAGRVAFGRVADRIGSLRGYFAASLGQTLVALLFPYAGGRLELYALAALFGLVYSGAQVGFILCAREYAPVGATARSIGLVMLFGWSGMGLGAWQGGLLYDLCGGYAPSFAGASIAGAANLLLLAWLWRLSHRRSPAWKPA
jgi:MFS family permease